MIFTVALVYNYIFGPTYKVTKSLNTVKLGYSELDNNEFGC
jgi:hypothetical protein